MENPKSTVMVYCAGGAASNIISELEPSRKEVTPGFAEMETCYLDTSRSNIKGKNIPEESLYIFSDVDGSGKVRSTNYEAISKNIKAILLKFKPRQFNIVVHSASGGSGSIFGAEIVSELKARGQQVIVIVVGSTDTRIEIENTLKTLKSYESIAHRRESPVVTYYVENSSKTPRSVVNKQVKRAISLLMGLFSGENMELDTADLKNWLEYHTVSSASPRLASLIFAVDEAEVKDAGTIISVATLATGDMTTRLSSTPAYQCVGFAPAVWAKGTPGSLQLIGDEPIHYCISDDFIVTATTALNKALKEVDAIFTSRNARDSLLGRGDNITDTGVVL